MRKYGGVFFCIACGFLFSFLFVSMSFAGGEKVGGGVIVFSKPVRGVVFFHKNHKSLDCDDCHDDIFKMKKGTAEKGDFTMKSMEKGNTCGACHDGDTAFSVKKNCTRCHIGVVGVRRLESKLKLGGGK